MASEARDNSICPVLFFGTPTLSSAFDVFAEAAEKSASIRAKRFIKLDMAAEKVNEIDHGVVFLLLSGKNDLLTILNYLPSIKKRIDQGVLRVMVFSVLDHDKIPHLLKSKGCSETLTDKLTQKALGHKLQKAIQIVMSKWQTKKKDKIDDVVSFKGNARAKARSEDADIPEMDIQARESGGAADLSAGAAPNAAKSQKKTSSGKPKIEFTPPLESENDCWLLKSKKDFKFLRGYWMGEMIGPGPSAGAWVEASGPKSKTGATFVWTPRGNPPDPFVPGGGKWTFFGRKPEFVWKTNRWRFISDKPTLYYQPEASSPIKLYRFNAADPSVFELAMNSEAAKSKIQAIIKTVTVDRLFKEEKKAQEESGDLELEAEGSEGGAWNDAVARGEEDAASWGELDESAGDDELPDWNDEVDDEMDPEVDWGGLDTGRGNKFNSGRGLGQGQSTDKKGYQHEEETFAKGESGGLGWKQGAAAFDKIKLDISLKQAGKNVEGVMLLERNDTELTLDAPAGAYQIGEKMEFDILLGKEGKSKSLQVAGVLLSSEPMEDGAREMIQIKVDESSRFHLAEIQKVFEQRQEQLLQFLREAKGG